MGFTAEANLQAAAVFRLEPELVLVRRDVLGLQRIDNCRQALLEYVAVSTVSHGKGSLTTEGGE